MRTRLFVLTGVLTATWFAVRCNARESAAPMAQTPPPPVTAEAVTPAAGEVAASRAEAPPGTAVNPSPSAVPITRPGPQHAGKASPVARPEEKELVSESPRKVATTSTAPIVTASSPPAPVAGNSQVVDPGGQIAVPATKAGPSRVGPDKCKVCHKIQFASWVETAHARRTPPLDCESCHGPGSEYKSLTIMKDPEKAKAAGLVIPTATFCANCHKRGWKDDMLKKAHAHKAPPAF